MESSLNSEELLKRFLLGNLSDGERTDVEDRFLADDDLYQELLVIEDDLIDGYVRGELSAPERSFFEEHYLSKPSRRDRVEFAQTLFNSVSSRTAPAKPVPDRKVSWWRSLSGDRHPALSFALAAALLVVLLGGLWLLIEKARTRSGPQQAGARPTPPAPVRESSPPIADTAQEQSKRDKEISNSSPAAEAPKKTVPVVATFTLLPGMVRGEGGLPLLLPDGATEVRLQVTFEGEAYERYRATISTPEGKNLWSRVVTSGRSTKSTHLTLSVPADLLADGDYVLALSGVNANGAWESAADYSFRIVRK